MPSGSRRRSTRAPPPKNQQLTTPIFSTDSDDDDDDIPKMVLSQSPNSSVSTNTKTPSSRSPSASENSNSKPTKQSPAVTTNSETLERLARETLLTCPHLLDTAEEVKFIVNTLLWHKCPLKGNKKKPPLWMPCRKADESEVKNLVLPAPRPGQILVRYIGDCLKDSGVYKRVPASQLERLVDPAKPKTIPSSSLDSFTKSLKWTLKQNPPKPLQMVLERCILEAIVQKCWKEKPKQPNVTPIAPLDTEKTEGDDTSEKPEKSTGGKTIKSLFNWDEEDDDDSGESEKPKQQSPAPSSSSSSSASRNTTWDPNDKETKQSLRQGSIVAYYDPNDVAGRQLLKSKIARVTPARQEDFKIHLEDGTMLRREDRVKLVQKFHRGKLVDNEAHAKFQAISKYNLVETKGGSNDWVGYGKVQQIKALLEQGSKELASNPDTAIFQDLVRVPNKKRRASVAAVATTVANDDGDDSKERKSAKRRQTIASKSTAKQSLQNKPNMNKEEPPSMSIPEEWWSDTDPTKIEAQMKAIVQSTSSGSRRNRAYHHMSLENLQCALAVRKRLYTLFCDSQGELSITTTLEDIFDSHEKEIGEESSFSLGQMVKFLCLDEKHLVKRTILDEIAAVFHKWLGPDGRAVSEDASSESVTQALEAGVEESSKDPPKRKRRAAVADSEHITARSKRPSNPQKETSKKVQGVVADSNRNKKDTASEKWWKASSTAELQAMIKSFEMSPVVTNTSKKSRFKSSNHHMSEEQLLLATRVREQIEKALADSSKSVGSILSEIQAHREEDPFDKESLRRFLSGDKNALIRAQELKEIAQDMKAWLSTSVSSPSECTDTKGVGSETPATGTKTEDQSISPEVFTGESLNCSDKGVDAGVCKGAAKLVKEVKAACNANPEAKEQSCPQDMVARSVSSDCGLVPNSTDENADDGRATISTEQSTLPGGVDETSPMKIYASVSDDANQNVETSDPSAPEASKLFQEASSLDETKPVNPSEGNTGLMPIDQSTSSTAVASSDNAPTVEIKCKLNFTDGTRFLCLQHEPSNEETSKVEVESKFIFTDGNRFLFL